jgi:hypothetical protein
VRRRVVAFLSVRRKQVPPFDCTRASDTTVEYLPRPIGGASVSVPRNGEHASVVVACLVSTPSRPKSGARGRLPVVRLMAGGLCRWSAVMTVKCPRCDGAGLVCEAHPDRPFDTGVSRQRRSRGAENSGRRPLEMIRDHGDGPTPSACSVRSRNRTGSLSPARASSIIFFAINSVIGSDRSARRRTRRIFLVSGRQYFDRFRVERDVFLQ